MDLLNDDEQQALADAFGRAAAEMFPLPEEHCRVSDQQWRGIAELGWLGIMTPEAAGGAGLGVVEAILLFRELGRYLVPGPILSGVLGARLAALAGDPALARAIASGERRVALITGPDARAMDRRMRVIDGEGAELGLWLEPGQVSLMPLSNARQAVVSVDPSTSVELCELGADPLLTIDTSRADLFVEALLLIAATAAGMCEAVTAQSADYARLREQFGRPIGMFQAVSHRCADMAARADVAWMQVVMAALTLREGHEEAPFQVDTARLTALNGAIASAHDNVQNHGGMGFTEELPPHRYVKRAFLLDQLLGGKRATIDRLLAVSPAVVQGEMRPV